jgi:hypothetical protein
LGLTPDKDFKFEVLVANGENLARKKNVRNKEIIFQQRGDFPWLNKAIINKRMLANNMDVLSKYGEICYVLYI